MVRLSTSMLPLARSAAERAIDFTRRREAALPTSLIHYLWFDGALSDVVSALAAFQNPDGGFGNRLEPDIHHPSSNPFAARIAMQHMLTLPPESGIEMKQALQSWLEENQADDGDWHFSPETKSGFMQPWFAAWEHPNLNPACCIAGLAAQLGIASDSMLKRVATLFNEKASQEEARNGEFYSLLPYVEYSAGVELPDKETWYELLADRIVEMHATGQLEDAEHFFTLALGGSLEITKLIPDEIISGQIDVLLGEQQADGGWPSPYDDAWRVWSTAGNMQTLARLFP